MDTPLPGFEERRVRTARRYGRIGVISTMVYLLLVLLPVFAGFVSPEYLPWLLVLFVAGFALHLWRIRELMTSLGRPAAPWFIAAASAVGLAITLVGAASGPFGSPWSLVAGVLLGDIVGGRRARTAAWWIAGATVVATGGSWIVMDLALPSDPGWDVLFWTNLIIIAVYVGGMWVLDVERLWWLKAVIDLDGARRTAAELATARERLRVADDLHDILGHALEVVAFKSELAARLQDVDGARARAEMEEVQRVARESLSEVRALVRDTRPTDLVDELAGAGAVLASAGVALTVHGDPATLGPTARNVLGRVLREAMTNVLRHAQPSRCTIEIEVDGEDARLEVVNDGALPTGDGAGTGLVALDRYLREHAGRLDAGPTDDGRFRVDARIPAAVR
ncbi:MAG: Histidine kinase [uncultured Pseudonocardia sp.]|uniref:Histidine kinase n=1 Tax=uncultured Pseudonocardia sp. TaxID=211455 RepID=A0A6J4N9Q7_9PSEU|nr:MAG: Histidine kinase [uncultured Pseudonocardia sp.]